ncbi:nicotinate-nucleotide diphosphorylase (carboxylating) [Halalkalibacillus sediminis]|uniref:Probable nicotinate-nucleotide pyrophosphorylase [carboxylating] n=1 Tax=Halalkalibacillus sediminis TaxID=2018042 RepID=A0A2I0QX93_9BACI|nr:carboxylating nicotinate-nucleotide diphosphorylase [Halalkalibacillus sediminis]PKR78929.1 nicotinate-nucleotide diphosphorylase (carboxylating) [Halalkalibacillus sediminis]
MNELKLKEDLKHFFMEDIGYQDLTSEGIFNDEQGEIEFVSKSSGYFCGSKVITNGYSVLNPSVKVEMLVEDGEELQEGLVIARASGKIIDLLKGERVILNLIQRLSGITTMTRESVQMLNNSHTKISDTRKTTPGLRMLEKYAVFVGGGVNHRFGLDDAVMIKDNHIEFAGSITNAVEAVRNRIGHMVKIEVETETESQVKEAIANQVDCIMLDNVDHANLKKMLLLIPPSIQTEVSGGITIDTLPFYSDLNIDVISLGYLTHQIQSLDISARVRTSTKVNQ